MSHLHDCENIIEIITRLVSCFDDSQNLRIAMLGYTDIMLNEAQWEKVLGTKHETLKSRSNTENLKSIHGRPDVKKCPTISDALSLIYGDRVVAEIFDFTKYEGTEITHDFNYDIPQKYHERYDIVIDYGSAEHIFNMPVVFSNFLKMAKINGLIVHVGALICPNHGFYSFNPTLFQDFYGDNGCIIQDMFLESITLTKKNEQYAIQRIFVKSLPLNDRFKLVHLFKNNPNLLAFEYNLGCLIKKQKKTEKIVMPIQHKYRNTANWL